MNVATEGNGTDGSRSRITAKFRFSASKLLIGAFAAYILYRCAHLPIAKHGMTLVLTVYCGLMLIHTATGCAALGWRGPEVVIGYVRSSAPSPVRSLSPEFS